MKNINLAANTAIVVGAGLTAAILPFVTMGSAVFGAFVGIVAVTAKSKFFKSKGIRE